jgi:Tfp pilus assembly protein PilW
MQKNLRGTKTSSGASILEMLVYVGILVIIVAAVGSAVLALSRVYRSIVSEQQIEEGGQTALERILRETRGASSIDSVNSTFASTTGKLTLNTTDSSGSATTVQFYISGQSLRVKEMGSDIGPLVPSGAKVTRFYLYSISTSVSSAVKVELTVESGTSTSYRSKNFYGTAVLRGSYVNQ